jgi:GntR family transcriptional regulator, arabinose operon transcriptional repressor
MDASSPAERREAGNASMKKYETIYSDVKDQIQALSVQPGDQLPTEAQYMSRYLVSRPTVAKALRMLEQEGLVSRRPGMGTFVRAAAGSGTRELLFGLAFPEFGHGEIFNPITSKIAELGKNGNFSLLWGSTLTKEDVMSVDELLDLLNEYVARKVDGVFFAPLEGREDSGRANVRGLELLQKSGIPVVLIDRDYCAYPERSRIPLIGIDNLKAGYVVADHYLSQGADRVDFVWLRKKAYTIDMRIRGYRLALMEKGMRPEPGWIHFGEPEDKAFVRSILDSGARNLICGNDENAALLMNALREMGVEIPDEIRVAAFDDVRYSRLISVPLTTIHQPVQEIAARAVGELLAPRSGQAPASTVTILLDCALIVRKSSMIAG